MPFKDIKLGRIFSFANLIFSLSNNDHCSCKQIKQMQRKPEKENPGFKGTQTGIHAFALHCSTV